MFFIVGEQDSAKRLAICHTEKQASEFIATLPGHEHGLYYIDAVAARDGVIVLASVEDDRDEVADRLVEAGWYAVAEDVREGTPLSTVLNRLTEIGEADSDAYEIVAEATR